MNIKTYIGAILLAIAPLFFTACGGGGGGGTAVGSEQQGQFFDSIVIGLYYETPTLSGFTDAQGRFSYRDGETIQFFVGDVLLGEAVGQSIITPVELVAGATDETNIQVQNIVMFLQTIDNDGDESNGITITNNASNAASGQSVDFSLAEGVFETDGAILALINTITMSNGTARPMVNRTLATDTFRSNLLGLFAGEYEGTFSGDDTGTWSVTISADGTIAGVSVSDMFGPDNISGSVSTNGQSIINGTVGTSVFSGNFSRVGSVSGTWLDTDASAGTFTGNRVTVISLPGSFGSLNITGNDANVIGAMFAPNLDPVVIKDTVFNTGLVTVNWSQSIFTSTQFESRSMVFRFNENDGSLLSIIYTRLTATSANTAPTSFYSYLVDCVDDGPACASMVLDVPGQKVTFNNTSLMVDLGNNNATAAIVLNGLLNW